MSDIAQIEAAAARLEGHVRRTPLLGSEFLDEIAGRRLLVKAECLQHTGSFKFRGAWSCLTALSRETRKSGVVAYSSGNHAQGVARAAQLLGVPAVIIMPSDAPAIKIEATRGYGAEVICYDRLRESREEIGAALSAERGLTLVKPYDEPLVIAGQGTAGLELADQAADAGIGQSDVLIPCGGGGLSAGIALALASRAPGLRVRTVEPQYYDDTARSLAAGSHQSNTSPPGSICDAILTPTPGQITFPILRAHCGPGLSVSDTEVRDAIRLALRHLKIVLEPGGAVALAAALHRSESINGDHVLVIGSGGNANPQLLAE